MSKRRKIGDLVMRSPGSGFLASADPQVVQIYGGEGFCMLDCGDRGCREWDVTADDICLYHISECQLEDLDGEIEATGEETPQAREKS